MDDTSTVGQAAVLSCATFEVLDRGIFAAFPIEGPTAVSAICDHLGRRSLELRRHCYLTVTGAQHKVEKDGRSGHAC